MAEKHCFIQFHHYGQFPLPRGGDHDRRCGESWHETCKDHPPGNLDPTGDDSVRESCTAGCDGHPHQRKFMRVNGRWLAANDTERSGELWAWGEWEAESTARELSRPDGDPRRSPYLWTPHYVSRPSYAGLHNTDPFIFGKRFLYSNCGQPRGGNSGLRHLGRGSVIIFGSQFKKEWVLDTVFVVAGSKRYEASQARTMLKRHASNAFLDVTGGPIVDNGEEGELRFYWGATPRDRVDGMFSFFPARPAGGETGFARPSIDLPSDYFNSAQQRRHKHVCDVGGEKLGWLWQRIVSQCARLWARAWNAC